MSTLGHHLVSRLLETEDIHELFLALRFVESPDWLNTFDGLYHSLTPADFESRTIRVVPFAAAKWGDIASHFIAKKRHNITHSKEMGAIAVMPMTQDRMPGVTLKVLPLLCHYFNEVRLYSFLLQAHAHQIRLRHHRLRHPHRRSGSCQNHRQRTHPLARHSALLRQVAQ